MLPTFWRFLSHFWIGAESVSAGRGLLYVGGLGVGADLLRLLAWAGAIVALLLPVSWKLAHRRERAVVAGALRPSTRLPGDP